MGVRKGGAVGGACCSWAPIVSLLLIALSFLPEAALQSEGGADAVAGEGQRRIFDDRGLESRSDFGGREAHQELRSCINANSAAACAGFGIDPLANLLVGDGHFVAFPREHLCFAI